MKRTIKALSKKCLRMFVNGKQIQKDFKKWLREMHLFTIYVGIQIGNHQPIYLGKVQDLDKLMSDLKGVSNLTISWMHEEETPFMVFKTKGG